MAKVHLGFFSFTEITDPSEHRSYNEWHQLDHMPEQYPLQGVLFGQRWVSTPECRSVRAYDDPSLAPIHYMTLYLMGEPVNSTLEAFRALGATLRSAGRFHGHRRSRLSGPFAVSDMRAAPRVLVSAEAVPYRPCRGIYVVVRGATSDAEHATSTGAQDSDADARLAAALIVADGVAGIWTFVSDGRFDALGWHPGNKVITVSYLDEEPLTVASPLGDIVRAEVGENARSVLFAGPLESITPWSWDWFDRDT